MHIRSEHFAISSNKTLHNECLVVHHHDMENREFTLYILADIAINQHFLSSETLRSRLDFIPRNEIKLRNEQDYTHQSNLIF